VADATSVTSGVSCAAAIDEISDDLPKFVNAVCISATRCTAWSVKGLVRPAAVEKAMIAGSAVVVADNLAGVTDAPYIRPLAGSTNRRRIVDGRRATVAVQEATDRALDGSVMNEDKAVKRSNDLARIIDSPHKRVALLRSRPNPRVSAFAVEEG